VWARGAAPPLARPLTLGGALRLARLTGWLELGDSPVATEGGHAEHRAGIALPAAAVTAWLTVRDQPLRGGFGLGCRTGPLTVAGEARAIPSWARPRT
jgi:hypothetical protein